METNRKRAPRATGTDLAAAAETPLPAEAPEEPAALAAASEIEPTPEPAADGAAPDEIVRFRRDALAAVTESQAALARCLAAISEAMAGLGRAGIGIAAGTATDMLGVKTLSDACEVGVRFARKSCDSLLDGSAKLSGLGMTLAVEMSRPMLTQWGQSWVAVTRFAR